MNSAIATRGTSGSTTGLQHILRALRQQRNTVVDELYPRLPLRESRFWNLSRDTWWDLTGASRAAGAADVLVHPCNIGLGTQPSILVVHDTMVLDRPELFDPSYARYARLLFGLSARRATQVVTPSRYSAERVADSFGLSLEPIVAPWPTEPQPAGFRREFPAQLTAVILGGTQPHKRQVVAIEAVARCRADFEAPLELVVIGPPGRAESDVQEALRRVDPSQTWARRSLPLEVGALNTLLAAALVVLQPSAFEGYGLPVAEAASFGTPSLHSGAGALPELAPSGIVGADCVEGYASAIGELLEPTTWRDRSRTAWTEAQQLSTGRFESSWATATATAAT